MLNNQFVAAFMLLIAVALNTVKTESPAELQPFNQPIVHQNNPKLTRAKRMYALCPPDFQKIGNECYFISKKKEQWLDAHFDCKDRNSKLAEPLKFADRRLKKYLRSKVQTSGEKWIGGMYNWQTGNWQYGYNGGEMKYQGFDENIPRDNLQYHCTAMDPSVEYKWTAKPCTERHYFICQHRMSFVNEKNRHKVYSKWNETYPNQMANEVEVYVSANNLRSNMNRKRSRVNRLNQANNSKISQQQEQKIDITTTTTSSTNAPDYLPYNAYKNLETMQEKPQEDIHSQISALQPEQQQTSLKQRKRHSKPIKISGDVDLGLSFSQKNQRKRLKKQKTTEHPQQHHSISSNNNNNHHHHPNNALPEPEVEKIVEREQEEETTVPRVVFEETSLDFTAATSTDAPAPQFEQSTMSELKKKLEEKALRRERLKAKLAQLTPEERQAFLLMKQQRADARKKGLNFAKTS